MDHADSKFLSSTPIKISPKSNRSNSNITVGAGQEVRELQTSLSQLALENEELKFELHQLRQHCHELATENQQLHQTVQDQREIQTKMKKQLNTVTRTVYVIYERFKSLKSRFYEDQFAGGGAQERAFAMVAPAAPSGSSRRFQCDDEPLR